MRVGESNLLVHHLLPLLRSRADDPVYGADRRNTVLVTDVLLEEPVADFPGENARIFLFVFFDLCHHLWRGNFGFTPAYNTRLD